MTRNELLKKTGKIHTSFVDWPDSHFSREKDCQEQMIVHPVPEKEFATERQTVTNFN